MANCPFGLSPDSQGCDDVFMSNEVECVGQCYEDEEKERIKQIMESRENMSKLYEEFKKHCDSFGKHCKTDVKGCEFRDGDGDCFTKYKNANGDKHDQRKPIQV